MSLFSTKQAVVIGIGAVAVGAAYVVVHDARRKARKQARLREDEPVSKEVLLKILTKSAEHSREIIGRIHAEVAKIKTARGLSEDQAMAIFQENFERQLDRLIGAIRKQYNVSEKAMESSFKQHQGDAEVMAAIQNMRTLSVATPAATPTPTPASAAGSSSAATSAGAGGAGGVPSSLTREKLKEIMTFNAELLESELEPIKKEMARHRKAGRNPQVDTAALLELQGRISAKVQERYNVTDEQVMAAVEKFGAREDPAFKNILQRIATTLQSSLQ